jgi:hypothetical protein
LRELARRPVIAWAAPFGPEAIIEIDQRIDQRGTADAIAASGVKHRANVAK